MKSVRTGRRETVKRSAEIPRKWRQLFALLPGYDPIRTAAAGDWFDAAEADFKIGFFPHHLRHVKGTIARKPYELAPWEQAIIGCLFGWKRADGTRRYRTVFLYVPKKNDKTTLTSGVVLLLLTCDGEFGAEIYSVAATKEQASIVFQTCAGMIRLDQDLGERLTVYGAKGGGQQRSIVYPETNSYYRPLSFDADTADGLNVHAAIIDELHRHDDGGAMLDIMKRGTSARRQPIIFIITTADYDRESVCNRTYDEACRVRDNGGDPAKPGYDPSFLPVIYEAAQDDDWTDPAVWAKANPNLGRSKSLEFMRTECAKAKEDPVALNRFKRFDLNIRTQQIESLIDMDHWARCPNVLDRRKLAGRRCYAGLDLGERDDLASLALIFPPDDLHKGIWAIVWHTFCCEETVRRRQMEAVPYSIWVESGHLIKTPGNDVDFAYIERTVVSAAKEFQLVEVAYDPRMATQFTQVLFNLHGIPVTPVRQGHEALAEATQTFCSLVTNHRLNHGGDPVAHWCASNTVGEKNLSGHVRPVKGKSKDKIDPIVAAIMAVRAATMAPAPPDFTVPLVSA